MHGLGALNRRTRTGSKFLAVVLAGVAGLAAVPGSAFAQNAAAADVAPPAIVAPQAHAAAVPKAQVASALWEAAKVGDKAAFDQLLLSIAQDPDAGPSSVSLWASELRAHYQQREADRATRVLEINEELDAALAKPETDLSLSEALRHAIELDLVHPERGRVLKDERIKNLIVRADAVAHAEEGKGNLLVAGELFSLLNGLMDIEGTYRADVERLNQRLSMVRFYAPHRLWEQREARLKAMGEKPLPPYNPVGDDYLARLKGVDSALVIRALAYAPRHVDGADLRELLTSGLDAAILMAQTPDLADAFPKVADPDAVSRFVADVARTREQVMARKDPIDVVTLDNSIQRVIDAGKAQLDIPREAILREIGIGAFLPLDDYSVIIWPDEMRRFEKNTQGKFVGVGVQIEYDEQSAVRIVTPLEGTPAHRAGIHPGDVITQIDGKSIYGLSLDQVVDLITGPAGTNVTLTIERKEADASAKLTDATVDATTGATDAPPIANPAGADEDAEPVKTESIEMQLVRSIIKVATVKGWDRKGSGEYDWNWFIDRDRGIGYVRLTQFADDTGRELDAAIRQMREAGLKGLILDLRFNPGGLMDQAVRVARRFIKIQDGDIVMARGASGLIESRERTVPSQATLADIPVVVLVNEGSASASEIVSGAVACYAREGDADALVLGARSFGKGSVQNVWRLTPSASVKLTIQYYMLPDKSILHRKPGSLTWGVEPNLAIDMLPKQTTDVLKLRRDADVMLIDENGLTEAERPNPDDLLTKGMDPQLETALLLLRARSVGGPAQAINDR